MSVLKVTLSVSGLSIGVAKLVPHNLHDDQLGPVTPDTVSLVGATGYTITAADEKNLSITRGASAGATATLIVESFTRTKYHDNTSLPAIIEIGAGPAVDAANVLIAACQVKEKYLLAGYNRVHMRANLAPLGSLAALAGGATQAQANAQANALQAAFDTHMAGVGTVTVDGEHLAADTTNSATLSAITAASSLATCITLVNGLKAAIIAHGNQSGVHFHSDASASGTGFTLTTDPPVVLADCIADLNNVLTALSAHLALASV